MKTFVSKKVSLFNVQPKFYPKAKNSVFKEIFSPKIYVHEKVPKMFRLKEKCLTVKRHDHKNQIIEKHISSENFTFNHHEIFKFSFRGTLFDIQIRPSATKYKKNHSISFTNT